MKDLHQAILELVRQASLELPEDVSDALKKAGQREKDHSPAQMVLSAIVSNARAARERSVPICQDTGTPIFYVKYPLGMSTRQLREQIRASVAEATQRGFLRPNAVDSVSGLNSGDNLGGEDFPLIYFEEHENEDLIIDLLLKGGGCENVGAQYQLPDHSIGAGRDLDGVRRAVLHAVHQAQGLGCAPGILGVVIGGDRGSAYAASKKLFLRKLDDHHPEPVLAALEHRLTEEANQLLIGPMGFGGLNTVLATKIAALSRLPASYFVTVSYMCWACRRKRMILSGETIRYE